MTIPTTEMENADSDLELACKIIQGYRTLHAPLIYPNKIRSIITAHLACEREAHRVEAGRLNGELNISKIVNYNREMDCNKLINQLTQLRSENTRLREGLLYFIKRNKDSYRSDFGFDRPAW